MSNMSYCRFHNTELDLRDCYYNLTDEDLSESEEQSRKNIIQLCIDILAEAMNEELIVSEDVANELGFEVPE